MYISAIVAIAAYGAAVVGLYAYGMFSLWEMILAAIMAWPAYAYAKSNKAWLAAVFSFLTIGSVVRVPYVQWYLGSVPVNGFWTYDQYVMNTRAGGITMTAFMVLYLLFVWVITTRQIKRIVNSSNGYEAPENKQFIHNRNFMYSTVFSYIVCVVSAVWVYGLQELWLGIIVMILVAVSIQVTHTMYCKSSVKERIKELNQNKKPLVIYDLNDEGGVESEDQ